MKVSVCLATYNGSQYVEKQIDSILPQLLSGDELIVVDDFSSDDTVKIIEKIGDSRIRILKNFSNLGVINSFEKAILHSSGDIIFLSDQDDLWMPDKVKEVANMFLKYPNVTLVTSNLQVIDEDDNLISNSKLVGDFIPGFIPNFFRPRFRGCTLAFRKQMLHYFLPFPKDIPMHDMWIGLVNEIYGQTLYIDKPLLQYRRHSNNVTSENHDAIIKILKWRYSLFKNLLITTIKKSLVRHGGI
jgi:glycosyltransferase involved in cell wall biosynthesis